MIDQFRARYKDNYVYFTIQDLLDINVESMSDKDYAIINHDPNTREQCSGVPDRKSNFIYEGDIIEVETPPRSRLVIFTNGKFGHRGDYGFYSIGNWNRKPLILGNKYDNPELLKTKTNKQVHEEAAGYNLDDNFFKFNNIDPEALIETKKK